MSVHKDSIKTIVINIISSIIFQIILMVCSGSGISIILKKQLKFLQNNMLTISFYHVVLLCICIIIFIPASNEENSHACMDI